MPKLQKAYDRSQWPERRFLWLHWISEVQGNESNTMTIDIEYAELVLLQAILDMEKRPLASAFLFQKASDLKLVIEPINWTRGSYFGMVVGQDDLAWLIQYRTKGALVFPFDEIEEGGVVPRFGDIVWLNFKHGIVQVVVKVSTKNALLDAEKSGCDV